MFTYNEIYANDFNMKQFKQIQIIIFKLFEK